MLVIIIIIIIIIIINIIIISYSVRNFNSFIPNTGEGEEILKNSKYRL